MRFHVVGLMLLGTAAPLAAQNAGYIQPEVRTGIQQTVPGGIPASSAVADLTARLDAMERQLATLTGQAEESQHRIRQLEGALEQYRRAEEARVAAAAAAPQSETPQVAEAERPEPKRLADAAPAAAAEAPSTGDPAEDAYLVGFRQWEAGQFAEAQKSLEAMAKKYPKHRRASYALNLAGRAYLDEGKPASAAKILLSSYQAHPKGERAADSLYFLGQALMTLKKPAEACKVYEELQAVYPTMRDWVKQRLPKARQDAKCSA
ncbi:MAG TPA: tetratricopeptide repeat protein [Allosphingosinicella sp.]|uniref:tetratricopeptide repeat protein n=1 Tax=Allosphingosinicella sp. TaxID=2823234 RepID=UPI002ED9C2F9